MHERRKGIMIKKLFIVLSWVVVLLWMVFIFKLSSQPANESKELSSRVTEFVVETVEKVTSKKFEVEDLGHIVRKNAHFFSYLIFGVLVMNAFRRLGAKGFKSCIHALIFSMLYAVSDEVHQAFVPGRGPQITDVLIDSLGVITGVLIYSLAGYVRSCKAFICNTQENS